MNEKTIVKSETPQTTLEDLRPGAVFVTDEGVYAVKSEYRYSNENLHCQCILLESGEYAHFKDGNQTRVREVNVEGFISERRKLLTEITHLAEDEGIYD